VRRLIADHWSDLRLRSALAAIPAVNACVGIDRAQPNDIDLIQLKCSLRRDTQRPIFIGFLKRI
jgi:hypothetical protein